MDGAIRQRRGWTGVAQDQFVCGVQVPDDGFDSLYGLAIAS
jgi:hypothetical protein